MSSLTVPAFLRGDTESSRGKILSNEAPPLGGEPPHEAPLPAPADVVTTLDSLRSSIFLQLQRECIIGAITLGITTLLVLTRNAPGTDPRTQFLIVFLETLVVFAGIIYGGCSTFLATWRQIRALTVGPELCESAALVTSMVGQITLLFFDIDDLVARPVYLSPAMLLFLVAVARLLDRTIDQASRTKVGISLRALAPFGKVFSPEQTGGVARIAAAQIKVGDVVIVSSQEYVPVDGEIVHGVAEIIERRLGGLGRTKIKGRNQPIYAGSQVLSGELHLKASALQEDSLFGGFISGLDKVLEEESGKENTRLLSRMYFGSVIFLALCTTLFWHDRGAPVSQILDASIGVLLIGLLPRSMLLLSRVSRMAITGSFKKGVAVASAEAQSKLSQVSKVVLDYPSIVALRETKVLSFEILDQRVDEKTLHSVLLSLLGDSDGGFQRKAFELIRSRVDIPLLFPVTDFHEYTDKGIIGTVQGVDFSVGNEAFLVERGVQFQTSDVPVVAQGKTCVYVAMKDEVVARFIVDPNSPDDISRCVETLRASSIRVLLCGTESATEIDSFANSAGIERVSTFGGLSSEEYSTKLKSLKNVAFFAKAPMGEHPSRDAFLTCTYFDEVLWNERGADLTLYRSGIAPLGEAIVDARHLVSRKLLVLITSIVVTLILLGASFFALVPPAAVFLTVLAGAALSTLIVFLSIPE